MSNSTSNDNGRALEYALTQAIIRNTPNARVDHFTNQNQMRDLTKLQQLPINTQSYFIENTDYFVSTILPELIDHHDISEISRLGDDAGTNGDVTDIRLLLTNGEYYNISLKHNHKAVKHQRPGALIKQLGLTDKNIENGYKAKIKDIENYFFNKTHDGETLFNQVKSREPDHILNLYEDVCNLVIGYINHYSDQAPDYFSFLVGTTNFDKVVITSNEIEILSFYDLPSPTSMSATLYERSYIDLEFDNGFSFRMRLHTASSRFEEGKSVSLKFDTHLQTENIPSSTYRV